MLCKILLSTILLLGAASLVQARGNNSGDGEENAIETILDDTFKWTYTLHTYNEEGADGENFLHGELLMTFPTTNFYSTQEFGFCMDLKNNLWDCVKIRT